MWRKTGKEFDPRSLLRCCVREIERKKKRLVYDTYAPNHLLIELPREAYRQIEPLVQPLTEQLTRYLTELVTGKGFHLLGEVLEVSIRPIEGADRPEVTVNGTIRQAVPPVETRRENQPITLVPLNRLRAGGE